MFYSIVRLSLYSGLKESRFDILTAKLLIFSTLRILNKYKQLVSSTLKQKR